MGITKPVGTEASMWVPVSPVLLITRRTHPRRSYLRMWSPRTTLRFYRGIRW